jgi:hypothetical protein
MKKQITTKTCQNRMTNDSLEGQKLVKHAGRTIGSRKNEKKHFSFLLFYRTNALFPLLISCTFIFTFIVYAIFIHQKKKLMQGVVNLNKKKKMMNFRLKKKISKKKNLHLLVAVAMWFMCEFTL